MFEEKVESPSAQGSGPGSVAAWKAEVSAFFSGEWDNLRDLIRRLEEHDWDGAVLEAPAVPARPFHERIAEQINVPELVSPSAAPSAPPESNRLADLARRLESRLKETSDV